MFSCYSICCIHPPLVLNTGCYATIISDNQAHSISYERKKVYLYSFYLFWSFLEFLWPDQQQPLENKKKISEHTPPHLSIVDFYLNASYELRLFNRTDKERICNKNNMGILMGVLYNQYESRTLHIHA
jgi:hypothetical protein